MKLRTLLITAAGIISPGWALGSPFPDDLRSANLPEIPGHLRNAWPAEWERDFDNRAQSAIRACASPGRFGNTFFENEKRSYPNAMFAILGGHRKQGLAFLQEEDNKAGDWNANTLGIDYFPAFTLKGQMRKLFFFGHQLEPAYRQRMMEAARIFTERDPYRRPNPAHKPGTPGWTPEAHNSWVDIRNTDNLFLMRATSVYLLAELSGNQEVRNAYLTQIKGYVDCLHHVGMAEWDSENYHGHSIAPLLNLYDFTSDNKTRAIAKSGLDWLFAAAAVKYHRGSMNGPSKRDYNQPAPLSGGAARFLWLYFGETPHPPAHHEPDLVHAITSRYRPPAAVVMLARGEFPEPVEILSAKPDYQVWQRDWTNAAPTYYETQYISRSFRLGTLLQGTQDPDVNGFKITVHSSAMGSQTICAAPCSDPLKLGSPAYASGILAQGAAVGQNANTAIYLTKPSDKPWLWWMPADAVLEARNGILLVRLERCALAIWPINAGIPAIDKEHSLTVRNKDQDTARWPTLTVLRSEILNRGMPYGFAVEIVEIADDRAARTFFESAAKVAPDTAELGLRAAVSFTAPGMGRRVRLQWGETPAAIRVWKDGAPLDIVDNPAVYRSSVIRQDWQGGVLEVSAGGHNHSSGPRNIFSVY